MNDNSGSCVPAYYCFEDEQHKEFVFPQSVIDSATTGGRHEVIRFRSRLEAAQHAIDLNPGFKSSFAAHFRPVVFDVTCFFIVGEALKALIQKRAAASEMSLEDAKVACRQYPYLKLSPESSGNFVMKFVEEALSIEGMAGAVKRIIDSTLEKLLSLENAANWGMSHILAWTLADCADHKHLRNQLLTLSPDRANKAIWKRAWRGKAFYRHFARAVYYLGSETAHFVLDAIEINSMNVREIEALLGLHSSAYYLGIASEAKLPCHPLLHWATTEYAGLHSSEALAIADTLREKAWQNFSDERSRRRFIHEEAKKRSREFEFVVLNGTGLPGLPTYNQESWDRCGIQAFAAGQNMITRIDAPHFSEISSNLNTFDTMDAVLSLRRAIVANDLSLDAQRVLYARIEGHTREDAHEALRIPKKRVAAAWRELNRKKDGFLRVLSPSPRQNCTLH